MKILKKLSALVVGISIFGSMAFATEYTGGLTVTEYAEGDKSVVVSLVLGDTVTDVMGGSSIAIEYDADIFTLNPADAEGSQTKPDIYASTYELDATDPTLDGYTGAVYWAEGSFTDMTLTEEKGQVLFTLEFLVNEGKNPIGAKFATAADFLMTVATDTIATEGSVATVTAAGPVGPIIEKTTADNGATVLEYTNVDDADKTLEGKFIAMNTATTAAGTINKDSRVIVTYTDAENPALNKSVTYGKTIFEYLGLDKIGAEVTAKAIKFGVVYTDASYKAANFSFEIK